MALYLRTQRKKFNGAIKLEVPKMPKVMVSLCSIYFNKMDRVPQF